MVAKSPSREYIWALAGTLQSKEGRVNINSDSTRSVYVSEVVASVDWVYSHTHWKQPDRLVPEVDFDRERIRSAPNVSSLNPSSRLIPIHDIYLQNASAIVVTGRRIQQRKRQIVGPHVQEDLTVVVALSAWDKADGTGNLAWTGVRGAGGPTLAEETVFDLAGGTAAITVLVVAIITGKNEAYSIAALLVTHLLSIEGEAIRTHLAGEAVLAAVTAGRARFTFELLTIPVGANGAADGMGTDLATGAWLATTRWAYSSISDSVISGNWLNNWFNNLNRFSYTLLTIPDLLITASDTGLSVIIGGRRAWGNTLIVMVDMIAFTLSTLASNKEEVAVGGIVVVAVGAKGDIPSIQLSTNCKYLIAVGDDETTESMEGKIVVRHTNGRSVPQRLHWRVVIVDVAACNHVDDSWVVQNVGH